MTTDNQEISEAAARVVEEAKRRGWLLQRRRRIVRLSGAVAVALAAALAATTVSVLGGGPSRPSRVATTSPPSTATSAPPACTSAQLGVAAVKLWSDGGSIWVSNISKAACSLDGYPTVQFSTSSGDAAEGSIRAAPGTVISALKSALPRVPSPRRITLEPAAGAVSWISLPQSQSGVGCITPTRATIGIPGQTVTTLAAKLVAPGAPQVCSAPIVTPFQPSQSAPAPLIPTQVVGPWNARVVAWSEAGIPIAGDANSLYLVTGKAILRVNPTSGAVLARQNYSGGWAQPGIAGGALWVNGTSGVVGFNLTTLAPVGSVTAPGSGSASAFLAVDEQDNRLYVARGNTVEVLDATTRQVINHYEVPGDQITSIAVSPDDTRLYLVGWSLPHEVNATGENYEVTVVDPSNGAVIAESVPLRPPSNYTVNAASEGGIWVTSQSGMDSSLGFLPASNLAAPDEGGASTTAGGGWVATATVGSNVVWIGGTSTIACADPLTGAAWASAPAANPNKNGSANITDLTPAGGRLFGYYVYDSGATYLVSLTPPAQCTG